MYSRRRGTGALHGTLKRRSLCPFTCEPSPRRKRPREFACRSQEVCGHHHRAARERDADPGRELDALGRERRERERRERIVRDLGRHQPVEARRLGRPRRGRDGAPVVQGDRWCRRASRASGLPRRRRVYGAGPATAIEILISERIRRSAFGGVAVARVGRSSMRAAGRVQRFAAGLLRVLLALAGARERRRRAAPEAVLAVLPFLDSPEPNRIVVDLAPEGSAKPLRLMLDTGASALRVTPLAARELGVQAWRGRPATVPPSSYPRLLERQSRAKSRAPAIRSLLPSMPR